jgi:hypothetical protein
VATSEESGRSLGALITRLAQAGVTLQAHGRALKELGPLAPQCLARPYNRYRQKVLEAAAQVTNAIKADLGAGYEQFSGRAVNLFHIFANIPELTQEWVDAPPQWREEAFEEGPPSGGSGSAPEPLPGMGRVGLGIIEAPASWDSWLPPEPIPARFAPAVRNPRVPASAWTKGPWYKPPVGSTSPVVRAVEQVARQPFWRRALSGTLKWASEKVFWVYVAYEATTELLIPGAQMLYQSLWGEPASDAGRSLGAAVDELLVQFEDDYLVRTAQQWQAVIKAARMSNGDPAIMKALMLGMNPWLENPLPAPTDQIDMIRLADVAGMGWVKPSETKGLVALVLLAGGSLGSIYAAGDE